MSKLPKNHQFLDLSDYGRPIARRIANSLKNTKFTPVDVTIAFVISGLIGVFCITKEYYWAAAFFLIFKSIYHSSKVCPYNYNHSYVLSVQGLNST